MGCFLGCFGGAKDDSKRRKKKGNRGSPQRQRNRIQNSQPENLVAAEQSALETNHNLNSDLTNKFEAVEQLSPTHEKGTALTKNVSTPEHVSVHQSTDFQPESAISTSDKETQQDLKAPSQPHSVAGYENSVESYPSNLNYVKPKGPEQLSPSPKKRVTFNSNVTTYEHVPVHESIDFQEGIVQQDFSDQSYPMPEDDNSVTSSVGSYPPNHRYHNARDSDDEGEEYGDSDLDDMDDEEDEAYCDDDYDEDIDVGIADQEVWSESVLVASMESRTGNHSPQAIDEEVESRLVTEEFKAFSSKTNARDRNNYNNSLLKPVENTTQWKAAKSRGHNPLEPQKENLAANFEPSRIAFSSEPIFVTKSNTVRKAANQDISVDASLSNWLSSPEITPSKKTAFPDLATNESGHSKYNACTSQRTFEDRPILGALTLDELRQASASASPRKSPSRSPDETPIIGTVGTYWNDLGSAAKHSDSYKGIPNTTSKYREDKRVNWHSTPFEKRLDRALHQGGARP